MQCGRQCGLCFGRDQLKSGWNEACDCRRRRCRSHNSQKAAVLAVWLQRLAFNTQQIGRGAGEIKGFGAR